MSTLRAYCQLCRLPALFTALADIMLGYLLTHSTLEAVSELVPLMVASAGLYLSGMVWNDVFDRKQDAEERPRRPIPSGRVSLLAAVIFAVVLLLIGLGGAAAGWHWRSLWAASVSCVNHLSRCCWHHTLASQSPRQWHPKSRGCRCGLTTRYGWPTFTLDQSNLTYSTQSACWSRRTESKSASIIDMITCRASGAAALPPEPPCSRNTVKA
jgi:hypothetical protein